MDTSFHKLIDLLISKHLKNKITLEIIEETLRWFRKFYTKLAQLGYYK